MEADQGFLLAPDENVAKPEVTLGFLRYVLSLQAIRSGYQTNDKVKILINRALLLSYPLNFLWRRRFGRLLLNPRRLIPDFWCKRGNLVFHCPGGISDMQLSDHYEPSVKQLLTRIPKGDAIDVGANFGLFTVVLSRFLNKDGVVLSIEPDPFYFQLLKNNIETNRCHNVIPINAAAWSSNTRLELITHQLGGAGFETLVSASGASATGGIPAITVDQVSQEHNLKPRFVKVDVEGAEYEVLSGMIETLRTCSPILTFEALTAATLRKCTRFLKNFEYEVRHLEGRNYVAYKREYFSP